MHALASALSDADSNAPTPAWREGEKAFSRGLDLSDVPYAKGDERWQWQNGYLSALDRHGPDDDDLEKARRRQDVLDDFTIEEEMSPAVLKAYIERHPEYASDFLDLFHELSMLELETTREQRDDFDDGT